jgi:hypothetical protein
VNIKLRIINALGALMDGKVGRRLGELLPPIKQPMKIVSPREVLVEHDTS